MAHLEVLADPAGPFVGEPQQGRLVLQVVVPTDRNSASGRTALTVSIDLTRPAEQRGLFATLLAGLLFTMSEQMVGVVAEVSPLGASSQHLLFATEDRRSLRTVIEQHWLTDRRLQFYVCPLEQFRRSVVGLRQGQPFDPAHASLKVVPNQSRSSLIIRGESLNTARARAQVERLCLQHGLEFVI